MSAWLGGVGVGLYLGIVGTVRVMAWVERKRLERERAQRMPLPQWGAISNLQVIYDKPILAPRTRDADVVDELVGHETYRGPDVA